MLPIFGAIARAAAKVASKAKKAFSVAQKTEKATTTVKEVVSRETQTKTQKLVQAEKSRIAQTQKQATRGEMAQSNRVFQRELANAMQGKPSALGKNAQQKVQIFYRATQNIWQGKPLAQRNEAILKYFNTDSLYNAFLRVMQKQTSVLKALNQIQDDELLSTEQQEFYNEINPVDDGDYLPELVYMYR